MPTKTKNNNEEKITSPTYQNVKKFKHQRKHTHASRHTINKGRKVKVTICIHILFSIFPTNALLFPDGIAIDAIRTTNNDGERQTTKHSSRKP